MKSKTETIDVTPEWVGLVPLFVEWIRNGKTSQRQLAITEITKIATLADIVNKHKKHGGLHCDCGTTLELDKPQSKS